MLKPGAHLARFSPPTTFFPGAAGAPCPTPPAQLGTTAAFTCWEGHEGTGSRPFLVPDRTPLKLAVPLDGQGLRSPKAREAELGRSPLTQLATGPRE